MTLRTQIKAVHWQMDAASRDAPSGAIVTDIADLSQSIEQAILTEKGSVPLSPERGLDLQAFRDRPATVRHLFLGAAVREALERDVPRIEVDLVEATIETFSRVALRIVWRPLSSVAADFLTTEVALNV